ncbi:MAG TPA: thiamine pyrophosphate-binding protein [Thermoanaerobaculia bacterium]|nr:thiamine pyrophosphate-binding protein [Thermoanaerobaculia bacterium]
MTSGRELGLALQRAGLDFFTGVPDSTLQGLFAWLERSPDYVRAASEELAVGLAVGAYLGGRAPAVLMQNSGLGRTVNALASLASLYRIPLLLVVGWRGHDGTDAPEHLLQGRATPALLDALEVPFVVLEADRAEADVGRAVALLRERRLPVGLLVRPGVLGG